MKRTLLHLCLLAVEEDKTSTSEDELEMPSITDTIYSDDKCQEADPEHGRTCIEMQFNAMDTFLVVGIAWAVLTVSSALAMDLAVEADEKSSDRIGGKEEQTWQPGQPIPMRRSNMSRSRAWLDQLFHL